MRIASVVLFVLLVFNLPGFHSIAIALPSHELLRNGNFESQGVSPPGWSLNEFYSAPGVGSIDTAAQTPFADKDLNDEEFGLWLRSFAGGGNFPSLLTNAVLSQTVPAAAGEFYSLSGHSRWEANYSGGVATLDALSPFGQIASPTVTTLELAFLDVNGGTLGTPVLLDLRTEQSTDNLWRQHIIGGLAPAETALARVTAAAMDLAYNIDPLQSAFFDDFSFTAASAPGNELLVGGGLDVLPQVDGWTLTELPLGTDTIGPETFANNPDTGGSFGVWLKPWAGFVGLLSPVDAIISQTVPGVPGGQYTFSAWSMFEQNYAGGVDFLDVLAPIDPGAPSPTQTLLEIAFIDGTGNLIDQPVTLDLRSEQMNDETWRQHTLQAMAPTGTASVRVSALMLDGVFNLNPLQSAFFDDFSLTMIIPEPSSSLLIGFPLLIGALRRRRMWFER